MRDLLGIGERMAGRLVNEANLATVLLELAQALLPEIKAKYLI